jgi:uncharacterized protein (TIGR00266 family)
MDYRIIGTTLPVLEFTVKPGERIVSGSGELSWMGRSIVMHSGTQLNKRGGILGFAKSVVSGGPFFVNEYSAAKEPGLLAFATRVPCHILPVEVGSGRDYLIHRRGFLCATPGVELSVGFPQSIGAGLFGGSGFVLQKLSGQCEAWVALYGEVVRYELSNGERLRVRPGHVGMFESSVNFRIAPVQGVRNMLLGGYGVFFATLTGPGAIWLQSLPLLNLAATPVSGHGGIGGAN